MRLDKVIIEEFKNLRQLHVDFDEHSPYSVLVGENGSGKSNIIEALSLIFRNLDLDLSAPFSYRLQYRCREHDIEVRAVKNMSPRFWVKHNGEHRYSELSKRKFMAVDERDRPLYRPAFVFGYYSGPSDRLASLYERHRERYYRLIIQPRSKRQTKRLL